MFGLFDSKSEKAAKKIQKIVKEMWTTGKKLSGGKLRSSIHSLQRMGAINSMDSVKLNQVINVLVKNQTWQIPTLFLYRTFANKSFKSDSWIEKFNSFPFEVKQNWIDKIS